MLGELPQNKRVTQFILSTFVATIAGIQLSPLIFWTPENLTLHDFISDDAFFYAVLARNLQKYGLFTFDGQMTTNGFQPLWMIVQAFLSKIFSHTDCVVLLCWSSWFCYLIFAFSLTWYVAKGTSRQMLISTMIVSGLVILNSRFQKLVVTGLEIPLVLLMLTLLLMTIDSVFNSQNVSQERTKSLFKIILLAIFSALTFLSRTDLFCLPLVVGISLALHEKRLTKNVLSYFAILTLFIFPYLLFNYVTQGSIVPISGRVKLFYINIFLPDLRSYIASDEWRGLFYALTLHVNMPFVMRFFISILFIGVGFFMLWKNRKSEVFPLGIQLMGYGVLFHLIFMHIVYRELRPYTSYYFVLEFYFLVLIFSLYISTKLTSVETTIFRSKLLSKYWIKVHEHSLSTVMFCSIILVSFTWYSARPSELPYWKERIELAKDIARIVPQGERVGAFWPGCISYFSGHEVIPMDGIVGSNSYFNDYVRKGFEMEYLCENSVKYFVAYLNHPPNIMPNITQWSELGASKIYEHRKYVQVITSRLLTPEGQGWYLLKLSCISSGI